jgi:hypothetical protein
MGAHCGNNQGIGRQQAKRMAHSNGADHQLLGDGQDPYAECPQLLYGQLALMQRSDHMGMMLEVRGHGALADGRQRDYAGWTFSSVT